VDDAEERQAGSAGARRHVRDNAAVAAVLAVLLITGPLGDHDLVGSWTGAALTVGAAVAVAGIVQFLVRPRG
jgi:hypothetical protein